MGTTYEVPSSSLANNLWSFARKDTEILLDKLAHNTTTLLNYCDGHICMGIKSGFTEAFIIDRKTRDRIISENPKSAEIISLF